MTWTKGPWRVSEHTATALERPVVEHGTGTVAVLSFPDEGDATANARLIAAAPEPRDPGNVHVVHAYQQARAALAKARGE